VKNTLKYLVPKMTSFTAETPEYKLNLSEGARAALLLTHLGIAPQITIRKSNSHHRKSIRPPI